MTPVREFRGLGRNKTVTVNVTRAVTQMYANVLKLKLKLNLLKLNLYPLQRSIWYAKKARKSSPSRKRRSMKRTLGRRGGGQPSRRYAKLSLGSRLGICTKSRCYPMRRENGCNVVRRNTQVRRRG